MRKVLETTSDPSARSHELVPWIEANQAVSHFLKSQKPFAKKIGDWTAELPQGADTSRLLTRRLVALLGKQGIRNLIVALRLARVAQGKLPRKKGESLEVDP